MGVVYLARDTGLTASAKPVAVKQIRPCLLCDPRRRERFVAEGRLTRQLRHPNIVEVFEVGEAHNGLYLAMEYIDGTCSTASVGSSCRGPARSPNAAVKR